MGRKQVSLNNLLIGIVILYDILPIVSRLISTYLTTYFYMLLVVLVTIRIIFHRSRYSLNFYIMALLPFIVYEVLAFFVRTDSILIWGYQMFLFFLPVVIGLYLFYNPERDIGGFPQLTLVAFAVTLITTVIGCIQYPSAARYLATAASSQESLAILYDQHNIGGYEFVYCVILLYPLIIFAYKHKKIPLFVAIICAIAIFALAILTEYTTALLMFVLTTILFFTKKDLSIKNVIGLIVVGVILGILFSAPLSKLLEWASTKVGSEDISDRLLALAGGRTGLEESEDNRIFLYRYSFNTFLSHPLFGSFLSGGGRIGGHSAILDVMGHFGLVGLATIFFMYRKIYQFFFAPFQNEEGFGYLFYTFLLAIVLSMVNTDFWISVLALYAPLLFCFFHERKGSFI